MSMTPTTEEAKTAAITLTFDPSKLFDVVAEVGDGGTSLGSRIVGIMLTGGQTRFREDVGLAFYGVSAAPASAAPRTDSALGTLAVPDGWMLVPEEETGAMWSAGQEADTHPGNSYSAVWRAMVEAATAPPVLCSPASCCSGVPDSVRVPEELADAASDLAQLVSYSEIAGDIRGSNRSPIRKACDAVFEIHRAYQRKLDEAEDAQAFLSAHPAGPSEQPILRATVDVFADRTDTRLAFGDRTAPEPGVKAVEQAIAALTAEYEARGGCPVVGRHPAGQSTGQGAAPIAVVQALKDANWSGASIGNKLLIAAAIDALEALTAQLRGQRPAPDSTRTGQVGAEEATEHAHFLDLAASRLRSDGYPHNAGSCSNAAAYLRALAACPAAPEAQGAWWPKDVRDLREKGAQVLAACEIDQEVDLAQTGAQRPHYEAIDAIMKVLGLPAPPASS